MPREGLDAQRSRNILRRCFIVQRRRKESPSTLLRTTTGSAFDVPADRHGFCLWRSAFPIAKVSLVRSFVPHFAGRLSKIQSRSLSPVEVTKAELDRIAVLDPKLKSYATVMADSPMAGKTGGD